MWALGDDIAVPDFGAGRCVFLAVNKHRGGDGARAIEALWRSAPQGVAQFVIAASICATGSRCSSISAPTPIPDAICTKKRGQTLFPHPFLDASRLTQRERPEVMSAMVSGCAIIRRSSKWTPRPVRWLTAVGANMGSDLQD